jgi:hypothetical protein
MCLTYTTLPILTEEAPTILHRTLAGGAGTTGFVALYALTVPEVVDGVGNFPELIGELSSYGEQLIQKLLTPPLSQFLFDIRLGLGQEGLLPVEEHLFAPIFVVCF